MDCSHVYVQENIDLLTPQQVVYQSLGTPPPPPPTQYPNRVKNMQIRPKNALDSWDGHLGGHNIKKKSFENFAF